MRVSFFPRALLFPMYAYELFSFNLHQYTTSMLACSGHEVSRRQSVTPPNRRGFPHSFWWFHQMIADILARHMIIMGLCINSISRIPFFLFCLQGAINSDNCPIISKCAPHNLNNHFTCIGYVDIITGLLDHTRRFFRNLWYWLDKTIYINANELRFNGILQYRRCCGHIPIIKLQLTLRFTRWRVY